MVGVSHPRGQRGCCCTAATGIPEKEVSVAVHAAVGSETHGRRLGGCGSLRSRSERSKRGSFASAERRLWPRSRGSFDRMRVFVGAARGKRERKGTVGDVLLCLLVWTPSRSGWLTAESCQGTAGRRRPRARLAGSVPFEDWQGEGEEIRDRLVVVVRRNCHRSRMFPPPDLDSITRSSTGRAAGRHSQGLLDASPV